MNQKLQKSGIAYGRQRVGNVTVTLKKLSHTHIYIYKSTGLNKSGLEKDGNSHYHYQHDHDHCYDYYEVRIITLDYL